MQSLSFQPILSPLLVGLMVAMLIGLLVIGPGFASLSRQRRLALIGLRLITILLVLLTLVRPGCLTTIEKRQSAVLLFLVDVSRSMQLPHRDEKTKRWEALVKVLTENASAIKNLQDQQIDVRFIAFDNQTRSLEAKDGLVELPAKPDGAETDIGRAIVDATSTVRDQRLLGVILASDGVQNSLDSDVELVNAANDIANQGIPLYAMPFGTAADAGQLADIAITNLPDHDTVFVKNRKIVRASLVSRGFANQNVTVQLVISGKNLPEQVVDQKIYTPRQSYEEQTIELSYTPETAGSYRMSVRAVKLPNESASLNNELTSFLTVYEGGLRVLYISDVDWWEQSRLKRSLPSTSDGVNINSQGIEIEYFPINQADRSKWPLSGTLAEAINNPAIDVIIVSDIDSRALFQEKSQEENLRAIEQAVARGKGLMMMGGAHSFGPGYYWRTPLADVLPIIMKSDERQEFDRDVRMDLHLKGPIRLQAAVDHPLVRLSDSDDYQAVWQKLPPLPGANRFVAIKENASVLLKTDRNEPILVAGNYGGGRVLAMAGDSTWLWYNHGFTKEHKRFWQQVILWLAFPDGTAKDSVRIHLAQRRFQPQTPVSFTAEAKSITGQAIDDATFDAKLISPDGKEQAVVVTKSKDLPRGIVPADSISQPGIYAIKVTANRGAELIGETEVEFSVNDQDREKANPAADPKLLARLADQTKEDGGKLIVPEELGKLLDEIAANPTEMKVEIPLRWQLGQSAVDSSIFLCTFVFAIACEWFLRKKWGLV